MLIFAITSGIIILVLLTIIYLLLSRSTKKTIRSVFVVNAEEATGNFIFTNRTPDSGKNINIAKLTNNQFSKVFIYVNGRMCVNNIIPVYRRNDIIYAVARKADEPWKIIFSFNLKEGDVIQMAMF